MSSTVHTEIVPAVTIFFQGYVRLINGRGFNMEEVIIFTEKKHTQKIAFLYGIFSEKNSYIIINLY